MEACLRSGHVRLCTLPSLAGHFGFTRKILRFKCTMNEGIGSREEATLQGGHVRLCTFPPFGGLPRLFRNFLRFKCTVKKLTRKILCFKCAMNEGIGSRVVL